MNQATAPTPDELRAEIEQTRAELGQTVDALTNKLDVKAQARARLDNVKSTISDKAGHARQAAPAPVQRAIDQAGATAGPVVKRARPYRRQIVLAAAGALALLLIARRRSAS